MTVIHRMTAIYRAVMYRFDNCNVKDTTIFFFSKYHSPPFPYNTGGHVAGMFNKNHDLKHQTNF